VFHNYLYRSGATRFSAPRVTSRGIGNIGVPRVSQTFPTSVMMAGVLLPQQWDRRDCPIGYDGWRGEKDRMA
jgi:hypothetical protein